jgi:hypothetical protein
VSITSEWPAGDLLHVPAGGTGRRPADFKDGIVLYDDPFFRGNSLPVRVPIDDLRSQNFHDRAESVRVVSGRWGAVCRAALPPLPDRGARRRPSLEPRLEQEAELGPASRFGIRSRHESAAAVSRARSAGALRGGWLPRPLRDIDSASGDLAGFGGGARSVQVLSGTWLLCDRRMFLGRCQQVSSSIPDLDQSGLGGRIMSARPIDR